MNADNEQYIRDLIEAGEFNGYTLVSGETGRTHGGRNPVVRG
jgi:hypothetical protein